MNQLFSVQIASRFVFVNLLPTTCFVTLTGSLVLAGAPDRAPSWTTLTKSISQMGLPGAFMALAAIAVVSIVVHPLSYPLIQLMEGYWGESALGRAAQSRLATRYERWRSDLENARNGPNPPPEVQHMADLPLDVVLPTRLGNVLRAGEVRAGQRYGMDTRVVLLRLLLIASTPIKTEVTDTRNQLDTAARLCSIGLMAVPVTMFLLWSHGPWMLVPLACYVFAWASYNSAIAAAHRFCEALSVAFDLHHLQLWDALSLRRPKDLEDEREHSEALNVLLDGVKNLPFDDLSLFTWLPVSAAPERIYDISVNQARIPSSESGESSMTGKENDES